MFKMLEHLLYFKTVYLDFDIDVSIVFDWASYIIKIIIHVLSKITT